MLPFFFLCNWQISRKRGDEAYFYPRFVCQNKFFMLPVNLAWVWKVVNWMIDRQTGVIFNKTRKTSKIEFLFAKSFFQYAK